MAREEEIFLRRERILWLLCESGEGGCSYQRIAREMGISEKTAKRDCQAMEEENLVRRGWGKVWITAEGEKRLREGKVFSCFSLRRRHLRQVLILRLLARDMQEVFNKKACGPGLSCEDILSRMREAEEFWGSGEQGRSLVGFTVTTLDPNIARVIEPGASPPHLRVAAARELIKAGIPVWVFIAPLLPGLSDTEKSLAGLLHTLHESGIQEILLDRLNPYPAAVHRLKSAYCKYFPEALPALEEYLRCPKVYQRKIETRLQQVNKLVGCRPYFV